MKSFLKELGFLKLILYLKASQNYFKDLKNGIINYLSPNINIANI